MVTWRLDSSVSLSVFARGAMHFVRAIAALASDVPREVLESFNLIVFADSSQHMSIAMSERVSDDLNMN